jgi:hypothetical protein
MLEFCDIRENPSVPQLLSRLEGMNAELRCREVASPPDDESRCVFQMIAPAIAVARTTKTTTAGLTDFMRPPREN